MCVCVCVCKLIAEYLLSFSLSRAPLGVSTMPGMVLHGELSGQQSSVWRLLVNTHWIGEVEELVMYVIMADSLLLLFVHFFQETVWETAGSQPTDSEEAGGHFD